MKRITAQRAHKLASSVADHLAVPGEMLPVGKTVIGIALDGKWHAANKFGLTRQEAIEAAAEALRGN